MPPTDNGRPSHPTQTESGRELDLSRCDTEPIRIPGSIQPHGVLLALDPVTLTILLASKNTHSHLGIPHADLLGRAVESLLGTAQTERVRQVMRLPDVTVENPLTLAIPVEGSDRRYYGILHRNEGALILELEPLSAPVGVSGFYGRMRDAVTRLQAAQGLLNLCQTVTQEVRRLTGFDRVMVYRFDAQWNGQVLAEDKSGDMDSYLGLHFPASDIPAQARELYRINRLRFVVDVSADPSPLVPPDNPFTGRPLDLTFSVLRSVSPVHLEYLRNMGVQASLSISIVRKGRLWGLIACHHATPRVVPHDTRLACEFLAQILSGQLTAAEGNDEHEQAVRLRDVRERLLAALLGNERLMDGLSEGSEALLELANASGAALFFESEWHLMGKTPTLEQVVHLAEWLSPEQRMEMTALDDLPRRFPAAAPYADLAGGVLAVFLARTRPECILWFRPEVSRTVTWAGNPHKPIAGEGDGRIHPRTSFAQWQETVTGTAPPWTPPEREAAWEMRNALTALALRGAARDMAHLNDELARRNQELDAFAYVASHDLKAPLRGISQLVDWIEEDFADKIGDEGRVYLEKLRGRVGRMQGLINGVLDYARAGRTALKREKTDVGVLLAEIVDLLSPRPGIEVVIAPDLPTLTTERLPLQQVFQNLISNALKYNLSPQGHVWITWEMSDGVPQFAVTDDGPGIAPEYHQKIFGVFQTLQARDSVESTGIGLALVRKIVEGRGGKVSVESQAGDGATFRFTWPLGGSRS